ncbi:MAG: prepilin peptidase [Dehalococcoidia bacterium]|nr:prepilin peptidase [Dehalococcoidia bacterium]
MTAQPLEPSEPPQASESSQLPEALPEESPAPVTGRSATFFALVAAAVALAVLGGGALLEVDARPALQLAAFAITVVAGIEDLRTRKIRNVLTAPALVLAFAGAPSYPSAALAVVVAPLPLLALAILQPGGMGMGDVKLAAVAGALAGLRAVPAWWVATALAGGLLGVIAIIRGGRRGSTMAYGPALVLAIGWVMFGPGAR